MRKHKTFLKSLKATRRQRVVSGIYGLGVDYEPRKRKAPARTKSRDKPIWYVRPVELAWAWKENGGVGKLYGATPKKPQEREHIVATPAPRGVAVSRLVELKAKFESGVV